jgi:nitrogen fixation/metabolism regulation signal transduction histidine kinase
MKNQILLLLVAASLVSCTYGMEGQGDADNEKKAILEELEAVLQTQRKPVADDFDKAFETYKNSPEFLIDTISTQVARLNTNEQAPSIKQKRREKQAQQRNRLRIDTTVINLPDFIKAKQKVEAKERHKSKSAKNNAKKRLPFKKDKDK